MKNELNERKKKSKKKIAIIVLSVVTVVSVAVVIWQWSNITAARYYLAYSQDQITAKIEENNQKVLDSINDLLPVTVTDLTDEEKGLMASKEITKEEAVQLLVKRSISIELLADEANATAADDLSDNVPIPAVNLQPDGENVESTLTELIAELYVLRAYYTNRLEEMRLLAIVDYSALGNEQRTYGTKMKIGMNYLKLAGTLETECDELMDDLVARIEMELKKTGGNKSIIRDIKYYYAEEKRLKKAYYLSLYT